MTLSKYLRLASQHGCNRGSPEVYPDKARHVVINKYENAKHHFHLTLQRVLMLQMCWQSSQPEVMIY